MHLPGRWRWRPRHPRPRRPSVSSLGPFRSYRWFHALQTLPDRRAGSRGSPGWHQGKMLHDQGLSPPPALAREPLSHSPLLLRDRHPGPAAPRGCTTAPRDGGRRLPRGRCRAPVTGGFERPCRPPLRRRRSCGRRERRSASQSWAPRFWARWRLKVGNPPQESFLRDLVGL